MAKAEEGTLTHHEDVDDRAPASAPALYLLFECDRLGAPSLSSSLARTDEVILGRARAAGRVAERNGRALTIRVPDRWMSSSHARLWRDKGGVWRVLDLHSKNGTILDGEACEDGLLEDGSVLELGHTLFLFRQAVAGKLSDRPDNASDRLRDRAPAPELTTLVPSLARRFSELDHVARSLVPVVLHGDTGTGKEVLAQAVHRLSGRTGPFVAVNCGSLPATLVETELFGYKKGAFSGASADKTGLVRAADGGTLFLDEIGDLPEASQAALLRVLQEREVMPVGAVKAVPVDLRVISATHRDLDTMTGKGGFRRDLLARLSGFRVELPALRERREDLGILLCALLARGVPPPDPAKLSITTKAARALVRYAWPNNIRELEKCLSSAVVLAAGAPIDLTHFPEGIKGAGARTRISGESTSTEDVERRARLVTLLHEEKGNIAAVARAMGKAPMQIHRWIKRYELEHEVEASRRRA